MEEFPTSVTIKDFKFGSVKVYDNLFKILIFGGNNVGKTSIMKMALTKEFPDNKIGGAADETRPKCGGWG